MPITAIAPAYEWVSSFLTAHQHVLSYLMPYNDVEACIWTLCVDFCVLCGVSVTLFLAGMVCVWVAGKTVWSPCNTRPYLSTLEVRHDKALYKSTFTLFYFTCMYACLHFQQYPWTVGRSSHTTVAQLLLTKAESVWIYRWQTSADNTKRHRYSVWCHLQPRDTQYCWDVTDMQNEFTSKAFYTTLYAKRDSDLLRRPYAQLRVWDTFTFYFFMQNIDTNEACHVRVQDTALHGTILSVR